jgi:hypothetical protein
LSAQSCEFFKRSQGRFALSKRATTLFVKLTNLFLLFPLLGAFLWNQSYGEKVESALYEKQDLWLPVFVRMEDQLVNQAGDYKEISESRSGKPRSQNRREVISILREKAERSWIKLSGKIGWLVEKNAVRNPQKFWIVNGFACEAKIEAIEELVREDEISYVYLDRFAPPDVISSPMSEQKMTRMRKAYDTWRESSPLSKRRKKIPWNVREIGAERAWEDENATGLGVTVAVIDSGILPTPALVRALAKKTNEELNGKDDDGNGLVDDLFGYDFRSNTGYILDDSRTSSHGSACAGIIAGQASSSGWQTGLAPDCRLLLLKGGFDLRCMEYLLIEEAEVLSMSYMIVGRDMGQTRGLIRNAFEHLSLGGVLALGGAGNYGPESRRAMPWGKQIGLPKDIPCVLAVSGVDRARTQLPFSSEGPCFWDGVSFFSDYPKARPLAKPDLCAFPTGYPVWNVTGSHRLRFGWKETSVSEGASLVTGPAGNSFSGPHAAGVAALVFSVNPTINSWEVGAILQNTAQDLGPPGRDEKFGAGLIDAWAAVRAAKERN